MKKSMFFVSFFLLFGLISATETIHKTLPNGLEVVVKENKQNSSVGFFGFVKTGSVNEGKYLGAGISHYLEHVVSSGTTTKRSEAEYNAMGKQMGAIVNAYTTYNATAYHIIVDKKYRDKALQILSEQLQFCAFDSTEVARERQVILKEIVMRSTPTRAKMFQKYRETVYPNSNKRYPVIGYTKLFKTITRRELADYYHKRYAPNNMVFVVVGDVVASEMMKKVEAKFKDFEREQIEPVYLPAQNLRNGSLEFVHEFEVQQPTTFISTILPSVDYDDEPALQTALQILFGNRKSPIRYKLKEELELVNYVFARAQSSINSPEGEIMIGFEAKQTKDVHKIIRIIDEEIEKYARKGLHKRDIEKYIDQQIARHLISTPDVQDECNKIGWMLMEYGLPDTYDSEIKKLQALTIDDLERVLQKHLLPKNRVVFSAIPKGEKNIFQKERYQAGEKIAAAKYQLDDNLTLLYRKNTEKPIITGNIFIPLSTDYETKSNIGSIRFMTNLILKGSEDYDPLEISAWKENNSARLSISTNSTGTFIKFKCLKKDFDDLKKILIDALENPNFPQSEITLAKQRRMASYKRSLSDARSHHSEYKKPILYSGTKKGISREKKLEIIKKLSRQDIINLYETYFNTDSAIFTFFGDLSLDDAEDYSKDIFDAFPDDQIDIKKTYSQMHSVDSVFVNNYDFEQVNIELDFPAPAIQDSGFYAMEIISLLLNGARGRLHKAVRGENDLAYYAFAGYHYDENSGVFDISTQTSLDRKQELVDVLKKQIRKLKNEKVPIEEINSAIDEHEKILKSYLTDNILPAIMTSYEARGLGYDYLDKKTALLKEITPEQIQKYSNKYFENCTVIISQPNEDVEKMVN